MAQATDLPTTSRFHNLSNAASLGDALGHADAVLKGAEVECKALKDEIKRRGLLEATGDSFAIRVAEQISGRLDVAAVKQYLGDSWQTVRAGALSTQEPHEPPHQRAAHRFAQARLGPTEGGNGRFPIPHRRPDHIRRKPSPGRQMRPRRLQRVAGAFPRG